MARFHRHPANVARYDRNPVLYRRVDAILGGFGSVRFLAWQTLTISIWIAVNAFGLVYRWDPYPFILLNLVFSTQAAYAAPLILLSQNRAAEFDRQAAEADHDVDQETLRLLAELKAEHDRMAAEHSALLRRMEKLLLSC